MSVPSPHLYRRAALAAGREPHVVDRVLQIQDDLRATGAYPVYTLAHLAQLTGAPWIYLREVVARRRDPYVDIDRKKRNGRTRPIASPEPYLMDVQRWLLHNILGATTVQPSSYAYQRGRSIVDCARMHIGARWMIKLDVHDFFDAIRERRVYRVIRSLGYPKLFSLEVARLCTRPRHPDLVDRRHGQYARGAPYAVNSEGHLPQGAPTSGALANVVAGGVDAKLLRLAQSLGLIYTRYSDDIVFSTSRAFSRREATHVVRGAGNALASEGFSLHRRKTRVVPPGARHVVLGLLIDQERVRLRPEFKRQIEVHLRGVSTFGPAAHAAHRGFESVLSLINHVDGCIAFASSIDAPFASAIRESWEEALANYDYPA